MEKIETDWNDKSLFAQPPVINSESLVYIVYIIISVY